MELNYIVSKTDENKKIKDILQTRLNISHRLLNTLKKENSVYLNDKPSVLYKEVLENDKITVSFDYIEDNSNIIPKELPLDIIYEDDWILVINKKSGIPVHPSMSHYEDSLSNGIRFYFDKLGLKKKIRPVNRLDKDTSGLVVFAKCEYIQEALIKQMEIHAFQKEYIALVEGLFNEKSGIINEPISRKENSIIERCVSNDGYPSITEYEVIKEFKDKNISVVKCVLKTGRTHQIRVHMSYIGHPLLGDDLYGGKTNYINRQALHCSKLSFTHPIYNQNITLESDIPCDMKIIKEAQ